MIALGLELGASSAAAAEPAHRYAVNWTTTAGADSCRQQAAVGAAVGKLVSPELLSTPEQADRIIVGTASHASSWLALLSVQDERGNVLGERELKSDAATCAELDDSVALAMALIIDPECGFSAETEAPPRLPAASPEPPAPASAEPPPPLPLPAPLPPPVPVERAPEPPLPPYHARPQRSLKGGVVVLSGLLPSVALGGQVELWLPIVGADSLRFSVAYFGSQNQGVKDRLGVATTLYAATARAAYCPLLTARPKYSVFGCAGLESGLMVAHGRGGGYDKTPVLPLLALDLALTIDRTLAGPWALSATAGGAVTAFRPEFSYKTDASPISVQQRDVLEARLEIGLAYRF